MVANIALFYVIRIMADFDKNILEPSEKTPKI